MKGDFSGGKTNKIPILCTWKWRRFDKCLITATKKLEQKQKEQKIEPN